MLEVYVVVLSLHRYHWVAHANTCGCTWTYFHSLVTYVFPVSHVLCAIFELEVYLPHLSRWHRVVGINVHPLFGVGRAYLCHCWLTYFTFDVHFLFALASRCTNLIDDMCIPSWFNVGSSLPMGSSYVHYSRHCPFMCSGHAKCWNQSTVHVIFVLFV